jgi:hypothetical protein
VPVAIEGPLFPQSDAFWIPRRTRRAVMIVGVAGDVIEDGIPDATSRSSTCRTRRTRRAS